VSVPDWVPRDLFPFESRFLDVEGHAVHYVDEGSGPPLLMLHGNPTWSFLYRTLILRLRDRFRCVALDYPGFGLSRAAPGYDFLPASHARLVEAAIDRLGLDGFTPVVQDWGGPIGLWVAGRHPEQVRALVVGNTWAWPVVDTPHFERFSKAMGGPLGRFAIRRFNAFVNVMIPVGTMRPLDRRVLAAYRAPFPTPAARTPTAVFPREILGSAAFLGEVEAGLARRADKPALVVWADRDVAFRAEERERFERLLPRHRSVPLPGAGHYIQEDAPDAIAKAVRAWWDEDVAPGPG